MNKTKEDCRAVDVVEAKPVEPDSSTVALAKVEVLQPLGEIELADYTKPAERINFHICMGQHHGRMALAHLILAGWELAQQKNVLGYGGWKDWCKKELAMSQDTADRYITFFNKTVGKVRIERQIPLAKRVTNKELDVATVGMEGKSATRAMVDLGIIKRSRDPKKPWGGSRAGAGRKPENAPTAEEEVVTLDEIKDTPSVLWGLCRDPLHKLNDLQRDRNFIDRLEFIELSEVYSILKGLFEAADKAMKRMQKEGRHA